MGHTWRTTFIPVVPFYLLAAFVSVVLTFVSEIPAVFVWFWHLAWQLSPRRSCPFPYDFTDYLAQPYFSEPAALLSTGVLLTLFFTVSVCVLHSLTFVGVVIAHRWFGWPKYWNDMRPRLNLDGLLALSARRSWWVWPLSHVIWLLAEKMVQGYQYAYWPIIDTGTPYLVANVVSACLIYAMISARVLQTSVAEAVHPDDLRCDNCGYPLRGLESARCPECGRDCSRRNTSRSFRLRFRRHGPPGKSRLIWLVGLIVALLLAPAWLPLALANLPQAGRRFVPAGIQPNWQQLDGTSDWYPIPLDAVCVVRHAGATGVVRFKRQRMFQADYATLFWSDEKELAQRQPPTTRPTGRLVTSPCNPSLTLGPWTFRLGGGREDMFLFARPDASYSIEIFRPEDTPDAFRWIMPAER